MKIKQLPPIFEPARPVLQRIEQAGYEAYFVGGCVRDTILGDPIHDIDIATSAYPSEIKEIFDRTVDTGIEHGTVMILDHGTGYETTTFRTESGYQDYRRPDHVTFVRSLAEDLKRRDFTINALALKENGDVVDLFDGINDLHRQLIRAVGDPAERFHEDALRMMRAVRFASKLAFKIDRPTIQGIKDNAHLLEKIAVERIQVEFEKMFLGQKPSVGLAYFLDTDLYKYCPGFADAGDSLAAIPEMQVGLENINQVWALICYSLELVDDQEITHFLKKWKVSNDTIRQVKKIVPLVVAFRFKQVSPWMIYQAGFAAYADANRVASIYGWQIARTQIKQNYQQLPIKSAKELAVNGQILIKKAEIKPGPALGKVLNQLTHEVLNHQVANTQDQLLRRVKEIEQEGLN